jgi:hypothetical protein
MAWSNAHAHRPTFAPMREDPLGDREWMPERALTTPEALTAAGQGGDRLRIAAPARAAHRAHEEANQREDDRGHKNSIPGKTRSGPFLTRGSFVWGGPCEVPLTLTPGGHQRCHLRERGVPLCMGVSLSALSAGQRLTGGRSWTARRSRRASVPRPPTRSCTMRQERPIPPCVASASFSSRPWAA